jgi:hypothetical protein
MWKLLRRLQGYVNEAGADGGFIVIGADIGIDRCYFLYLLEHALCKSPVLSRVRS